MTNHLYYGDNLALLRDSIASASVDLVYLDPPSNSNASYNVLFKGPSGNQSAAQIEALDDTWHWTDAAEEAFAESAALAQRRRRDAHRQALLSRRPRRDRASRRDMSLTLSAQRRLNSIRTVASRSRSSPIERIGSVSVRAATSRKQAQY
jgi:site-specific DNA-methyltransferase (adenine-specific)